LRIDIVDTGRWKKRNRKRGPQMQIAYKDAIRYIAQDKEAGADAREAMILLISDLFIYEPEKVSRDVQNWKPVR
jgi:hypothetical protein